MLQYSWIIALIPAFPLLGFLLNALVIRRARPAGLVASLAVLLSFVTALGALALLLGLPAEERRIDLLLWEWIAIGSLRVPFGLLFDSLTAVMTLLITGVGAIIHFYSIAYMQDDERPARFFAAMNLFVVAMLVLVLADNLLLLFLGWEGVGLCSFLLIGHYFDRRSVQPGIVPSEAAVKAFVVNRIGDAGFLLAMFAIFSRLGSLSFYSNADAGVTGFLEQISAVGFTNIDLGIFGQIGLMTAVGWLLLLAVAGKSAQIPLYTWLPDAMAGPTPVSALIHAATMVTAGVYLIARNQAIFISSPDAAGWAVGIGTVTALFAALAAVAQFDIKRVLAYSTISQLGYMIVAVAMGAVTAGMFHLLTHGIFKALLFLAAGSVIHGAHGHQDMRRMGGLRHAMPRTFATFVIGAAALAGIFPLAGFWSKDEIIAAAWSRQQHSAAITLIIASMITAFYMARQVTLIFLGRQRDEEYHPHESAPGLTVPLIILAVGAVLGGLLNLPGLHWLESFLTPGEAVAEQFNLVLAIVTTLLSIGAAYLGWLVYARLLASRVRVGREDPFFRYLGDIWRGMEIGWGFDWVYSRIARGYRALARFLDTVFDREGIDGVLVGGVGRGFGWLTRRLRAGQTGYVRTYVLVFLIGVVVVVGYFALS